MPESIQPAAREKAPFDWRAALVVALWIAMTILAVVYLADLGFL